MANDRTFIICVSQPGCLPEGEPRAVKGVKDARTALIEEIELTAATHDLDEPMVDAALARAQTLDTNGASVALSGYVHEVLPRLSEVSK